jgi:GNAT superfamily N-acetyltransferase
LKALDLLKETLVDNRSVIFSIGSKGFFRLKVWLVAHFLYSEASRNNGVFIDSKNDGIICFFEAKEKRSASFIIELGLILFGIGPLRILRVWRRKKEVQRFHSHWENYIHCSYLAVRKSARGHGAILELRDALFRFQQEKQLPILIETTIEKNKRVYERIGFHVHDERVVSGFKTYCMVREHSIN